MTRGSGGTGAAAALAAAVLACALLLALPQAAGAHSGVVWAELETAGVPVAGQPAELTLLLFDDYRFGAIGATVRARGEGARTTGWTRLTEQAEGVYKGRLTFPGAGDWTLHVDIAFADEERGRVRLPVRVAAAGEAPGRPQRPRLAVETYQLTLWDRIGPAAGATALATAAVAWVIDRRRRRR